MPAHSGICYQSQIDRDIGCFIIYKLDACSHKSDGNQTLDFTLYVNCTSCRAVRTADDFYMWLLERYISTTVVQSINWADVYKSFSWDQDKSLMLSVSGEDELPGEINYRLVTKTSHTKVHFDNNTDLMPL